jgi:hypothetical protein
MKLKSHISCSWECTKMWGNEPSHSQMNSHFGSWNLDGLLNLQRAISRVKIHYVETFFIPLEKLLRRRCLKWVCMNHLSTWNICYGQKKGRESKYQFDYWPLEVGNRPDFLMYRWCATYRWKALDKGYNSTWTLTSIRGLHTKLWASRVAGVLISKNLGLPTWESWDKMTFGCWPYG